MTMGTAVRNKFDSIAHAYNKIQPVGNRDDYTSNSQRSIAALGSMSGA